MSIPFHQMPVADGIRSESASMRMIPIGIKKYIVLNRRFVCSLKTFD